MKDELVKIAELIAQQQQIPVHNGCSNSFSQQSSQFESACSEARQAWASAAFMGHGKNVLKRYFTYQMRVLCDLLNQVNSTDPGATEIVSPLIPLAEHLIGFFPAYLDKAIVPPAVYIKYKISSFNEKAGDVYQLLESRSVPAQLQFCLKAGIDSFLSPESWLRLSLGSLDYLELMLVEILQVLLTDQDQEYTTALEERLMAINFNHLEYFKYLVKKTQLAMTGMEIMDKYELLIKIKNNLRPDQYYEKVYFDSFLPPIIMMYRGWLSDEALVNKDRFLSLCNLPTVVPEKISLPLSVAEISCLTRLFVEASVHLEETVTSIQKIVPLHFSAKRQAIISPGSFSKKYYCFDQQTAIKVKALLLKMLAWLNKHYFPVMAVISAVIAVR